MDFSSELMSESVRLLKKNISRKKYAEFSEDARTTCSVIIKRNWNGHFFQSGHINHKGMDIRDIGICSQSLCNLGYKNEVIESLHTTLKIYQHYNKITSKITPKGKTYDIEKMSIDALPFLIRSLRIAKSWHLLHKYHDFLNKEIEKYYKEVFDEHKQIVFEKKYFSELREGFKRKSSMYANCCVAMLNMELIRLKKYHDINLINPFKDWGYKKVIKDRFWVGTHFLDDISNHHHFSADANIIPFYFKIFQDKDMISSCVNTIIDYKLENPVPMKHTYKAVKEKENPIFNFVSKGIISDCCWTNLGMIFLEVLKETNKTLLKKYLERYSESIEKYKNLFEAYTKDGQPYSSPLYKADEGSIYASVLYDILSHYHKSDI